MMSNRCPKCGSIAEHMLTTTEGERYYRCSGGLATFGNRQGKVSHIQLCETVIDTRGKLVTDTLMYRTGDKVKSKRVVDGRVV